MNYVRIGKCNEYFAENDASVHPRVYSFMTLTVRMCMICTLKHACQSVIE